MNQSNGWIELSQLSFDDVSSEPLHGVRFRVLPSPNDLPQAFRYFEDLKLNEKAVDFSYLVDEPTVAGRFAKGAKLLYGRRTKRVHRIALRIVLHEGVDAFKRRLQDALLSLSRVFPRSTNDENVRAVLRAISLHLPAAVDTWQQVTES